MIFQLTRLDPTSPRPKDSGCRFVLDATTQLIHLSSAARDTQSAISSVFSAVFLEFRHLIAFKRVHTVFLLRIGAPYLAHF